MAGEFSLPLLPSQQLTGKWMAIDASVAGEEKAAGFERFLQAVYIPHGTNADNASPDSKAGLTPDQYHFLMKTLYGDDYEHAAATDARVSDKQLELTPERVVQAIQSRPEILTL